MSFIKEMLLCLEEVAKKDSLFNASFSTFEADNVYNQKDAEGFIKLNALRFIIAGKNGRKI